MSASFPKQWRQNLKADALSLNPPSAALAGLSADTTLIVPRKLQILPLTSSGTPLA